MSIYAFVPMTEKKGGLRQMMHMTGLRSYEYFTGLLLADTALFTIPIGLICVFLAKFALNIVEPDQIVVFAASYLLYGFSCLNTVYLITHLFDDPDTSFRYVATIF